MAYPPFTKANKSHTKTKDTHLQTHRHTDTDKKSKTQRWCASNSAGAGVPLTIRRLVPCVSSRRQFACRVSPVRWWLVSLVSTKWFHQTVLSTTSGSPLHQMVQLRSDSWCSKAKWATTTTTTTRLARTLSCPRQSPGTWLLARYLGTWCPLRTRLVNNYQRRRLTTEQHLPSDQMPGRVRTFS